MDSNLFENNRLKVVSSSFYEKIPQNDLSYFCWKHGFYCLPTIELCDWLRDKINGRRAIEIGCGNGAVGRYLDIPTTDSRLQENKDVQGFYATFQQPVMVYPNDVIKMTAEKAIRHYEPEVVIACWVTQIYREQEHHLGGSVFGVDEDDLLNNVDCYIHVGHQTTHGMKRILKRKHVELTFPWMFSRSPEVDKNVIYVWEK